MDSLDIQPLCRKHHGRISRMDTGILNMLRDGIDDNFSIFCSGIDFYLFRILDELGDDNRMLRIYIHRFLKIFQ